MSNRQEPPVPAPSEPASPPPSFEQAVARLGEIVHELERGELPLEESLELFEQGIQLARDAQTRLDQAERRVEELLGFDEHHQPILRELDANGRQR
jgi:exodeoxyribonuclease VII small subunit